MFSLFFLWKRPQPQERSLRAPQYLTFPKPPSRRLGPDGQFLRSTGWISTTAALKRYTLLISRSPAFIGPSGCGRPTLLRCFNRMNDLIDHAKVTAGEIWIEGVNIHGPDVDVEQAAEASEAWKPMLLAAPLTQHEHHRRRR
jgi:hypothetical protein